MDNKIMDLPFGLDLCKRAFRKNPNKKKLVIAAYIEGNQIIIDSNSFKTHPLARRHNHMADRIHAELSVLRHIKDGSKGVLYVYREHMDNTVGLASPCQYCRSLLKEKNIRKVFYTTNDGWAKEKLFY